MRYTLDSMLPLGAFEHCGNGKIRLHGGVAEAIGGVFEDVGEAVGDVVSDVGKAVESVTQTVSQAAESAAEAISDAGVGLDKSVNDAVPGGWATVGAIAATIATAGAAGAGLLAAEGAALGAESAALLEAGIGAAELGTIGEGALLAGEAAAGAAEFMGAGATALETASVAGEVALAGGGYAAETAAAFTSGEIAGLTSGAVESMLAPELIGEQLLQTAGIGALKGAGMNAAMSAIQGRDIDPMSLLTSAGFGGLGAGLVPMGAEYGVDPFATQVGLGTLKGVAGGQDIGSALINSGVGAGVGLGTNAAATGAYGALKDAYNNFEMPDFGSSMIAGSPTSDYELTPTESAISMMGQTGGGYSAEDQAGLDKLIEDLYKVPELATPDISPYGLAKTPEDLANEEMAAYNNRLPGSDTSESPTFGTGMSEAPEDNPAQIINNDNGTTTVIENDGTRRIFNTDGSVTRYNTDGTVTKEFGAAPVPTSSAGSALGSLANSLLKKNPFDFSKGFNPSQLASLGAAGFLGAGLAQGIDTQNQGFQGQVQAGTLNWNPNYKAPADISRVYGQQYLQPTFAAEGGLMSINPTINTNNFNPQQGQPQDAFASAQQPQQPPQPDNQDYLNQPMMQQNAQLQNQRPPFNNPLVESTSPFNLQQPSQYDPTNSVQMFNMGGVTYAGGGISNLGHYSDGGRLLRGPGDGLSDDIPATIGNKQPARLADGEFVISSDVVSSLGGGSTEAGAKVLYSMMDRIRHKAHGTKKQIKKIDPKKVLPA